MESGGSARQEYVAKQVLKCACALLAGLNLPVSGRHNAMHGINEIASVLVYMCANKATFNSASRNMKKEAGKKSDIPTGQWVLNMLRSPSIEEMERKCKKALAGMVGAARGGGMLAKTQMIAIDGKLIPATGDRETAGGNVTGGKPKGGTSWFFHLLTAQIATGPFRPTVAIERVTKSRDVAACLEGILSAVARLQLRPRLCLLDKGFFGIRAMEIMAERGIPFLMPARMTPGIKDAVDEVRRGARKKISRYTMMSSRRAFTFYLIVEKRMKVKDGRRQWVYIAFATNVPRHRIPAVMKDVPETYKRRWTIENGYKSMDSVRPPTCTRSYSARLLLFYMSALSCNFWYLANSLERAEAVKAGVPRRRAAKIRAVLKDFAALVAEMAAKILSMSRAEARRYLDGGG